MTSTNIPDGVRDMIDDVPDETDDVADLSDHRGRMIDHLEGALRRICDGGLLR